MAKKAVLLALLALGCGDGRSIERTVGTLERVRGAIEVGDASPGHVARIAAGEQIELGEHAMARLALDHGPRVILGASSAATLTDEETLELTRGRAFVEAAGERHAADPRRRRVDRGGRRRGARSRAARRARVRGRRGARDRGRGSSALAG